MPGECGGLVGSPLDRRLTFASFLVGKSNQLAHAAAMRLARADAGEASPYNPLYIHASVGLGKTHLLQAIGQEVVDSGNTNVLYATSESFTNELISSIRDGTTNQFRERYRRCGAPSAH